MYVSKNLILGLLLAGAGLLGWATQSLIGSLGASAPALAVAPAPDQPAANGPATPVERTGPDTPGTEPAVASDTASNDNVYMTIVNSSGATQSGQPAQAIATANATSTTPQGSRATQAVAHAPSSGSSRQTAASGQASQVGQHVTAGPVGSCGAAGQPHVCINGNNITIATNGAVVMLGDDGRLNASTGDTSASGTVAIDAQGSTLTSGTSTVSVKAPTTIASSSPTSAGAAPATSTASSAPATSTASSAAPSTASATTGTTVSVPDHSNGSLDSMLVGLGDTGTSVSIAGFEDHSVSVIGNDHLVTYDDSNVFVNRIGQVNANTGDTDSSGLNVVDAIDSVVRSGNSGDGEGGDDEEEPDEDETPPTTTPPAGGDGTTVDDDDSVADGDETSDGDAVTSVMTSRTTLSALDALNSPSASAGVDDEDVATTANGTNAFVIGADGFDDVSIRVWGNHDIVTYDDSNVVLGGYGNVNAQIGDSDTAGAVVMGVRNSYIQAGCEGDLCYSGQTQTP